MFVLLVRATEAATLSLYTHVICKQLTVYTTDKGATLFTDKDQNLNSQECIVMVTIEALVPQERKAKTFSLGIVFE